MESRTGEQRNRGYAIRIIRHEGHEKLWIDGLRCSFFATADGYNLRDDAYAPPQQTLPEAAQRYIDSLPPKNR